MTRTGFQRAVFVNRNKPPLGKLTRPVIYGLAAMREPQPKEEPWRSEPYRRLVVGFACEHCCTAGRSQAAHADQGKGMGIKSDDRTCFAACADTPGRQGCHSLIGSSGAFTQDQRRTLERTYATRTINRVRQMGLWPEGLAYPEWYTP